MGTQKETESSPSGTVPPLLTGVCQGEIRHAALAAATTGISTAAAWTVVRLAGSLGEHAAEWDTINTRSFSDHPLLGSPCVDALMASYATGREVLAIRRRGAEVDAMCLLEPNGPGVWRSFLPAPARIGPTLICSAAQLGGLMEALPGIALRVELLCQDPRLSKVCVEVPRRAVTFRACGTVASFMRREGTSSSSGLATGYEGVVSGSDDAAEWRRIDSPAEMKAAIDRCLELERSGRGEAEGHRAGDQSIASAFHAEWMRRLAGRGAAHAYEQWTTGRLAASMMVVRQGSSIVIVKVAASAELRGGSDVRPVPLKLFERVLADWPGVPLDVYAELPLEGLACFDHSRTLVDLVLYRSNAVRMALRAGARVRQTLPGRTHAGRSCNALPDRVDAVSVDDLAEPELARLVARHERDHFQLGVDWWRVYGETVMAGSSGMRLFLLRRAGRPVALLPANVEPTPEYIGGMVGALSNFYTTIYAPLIAPDATGLDLLPLVRRLREECSRRAALQFEPLAPDSRSTQALEWALDAAGYSVSRYDCSGNWYLPVRGSWAQYLAGCPGDLRNTIRRKGQKLVAAGGELQVVHDQAALPVALEAFAEVYRRSWKRAEPVTGFIELLAQTYGQRGALRLGVARIGGKPIAAQIWIVINRVAYIYKLAYDLEYKQFAPGTVLTAHLMRRVFESEDVREVDFLAGDDAFKRQWMRCRRERCGLIAHDLRSVSGWLGAARESVSRALRHGLRPAAVFAGTPSN